MNQPPSPPSGLLQFCPWCGSPREREALFCRHCGKPLEGGATGQAGGAAPGQPPMPPPGPAWAAVPGQPPSSATFPPAPPIPVIPPLPTAETSGSTFFIQSSRKTAWVIFFFAAVCGGNVLFTPEWKRALSPGFYLAMAVLGGVFLLIGLLRFFSRVGIEFNRSARTVEIPGILGTETYPLASFSRLVVESWHGNHMAGRRIVTSQVHLLRLVGPELEITLYGSRDFQAMDSMDVNEARVLGQKCSAFLDLPLFDETVVRSTTPLAATLPGPAPLDIPPLPEDHDPEELVLAENSLQYTFCDEVLKVTPTEISGGSGKALVPLTRPLEKMDPTALRTRDITQVVIRLPTTPSDPRQIVLQTPEAVRWIDVPAQSDAVWLHKAIIAMISRSPFSAT